MRLLLALVLTTAIVLLSGQPTPATVQTLTNAQKRIAVDIITPDAQTSTASYVAMTGGNMDARMWNACSFTIAIATQSVKWTVYEANASDYSDEAVAQAEATVVAAAVGSFSVTTPPFSYYRVKIVDASGGVHGVATVRGFCK